jgi:Glycosyl transferase family 2
MPRRTDDRHQDRVDAEQLWARVHTLELHASTVSDALAAQQRAMEGLEARICRLEHVRRIWEVMAYVRGAAIEEAALVSVILATRNRSSYLPRAIGSVLAQTYSKWELVAVDDGSEDDTYHQLGEFGDPRIRRFRSAHGGPATARNHALAEASGDYVTYLDDDNAMHPEWLRSVVWAFANWPRVDLLYGAMIIDDDSTGRGLPWVRFVPYSREELTRENPTDIGAVAHRSGVAEAVFDEELRALEDWDLLLRMSVHHEVLALPAIAGVYGTSAPGRLTGSPEWDRAWNRLLAKHHFGVRALPTRGG